MFAEPIAKPSAKACLIGTGDRQNPITPFQHEPIKKIHCRDFVVRLQRR
jgi:hypothetical protein